MWVPRSLSTYCCMQFSNILWKVFASMFIGDMTPEEVLEAIDTGRAQLAEAAGDENWK